MAQPAEYLSPYESEIITIIVGTGDGAHNFQLHKDVACGTSLFSFGCLATEHFPEGRLKTILLPEDDPEIFKVVLAFVYACTSLGNPLLPTLPTSTYIMAYVLADKLLMGKICNHMMRSITAYHNTRDAFSCVLGGQTAFDLPECIATKFLIEQLRGNSARKAMTTFVVVRLNKRKVTWRAAGANSS